jgi:hypothetical protein
MATTTWSSWPLHDWHWGCRIYSESLCVVVLDGNLYISDSLTANNKPRMTLFAPSLPNNEEDNGHVMTRGLIILVFYLKIYLNNIFFLIFKIYF